MNPAIMENTSDTAFTGLESIRVALPGLGGVGGSHLHVLAEMGIRRFHIADPDTFELVNFNRQWGAHMDSIGLGKAESMAAMARTRWPGVEIETFPEGIHQQNIGAFLKGVDVVVDGIEFFAIEARRLLHAGCREQRIPVVQAGPFGYGAALVVFVPSGPTFEEFFRIEEDMTRAEMLGAHAMGHSVGFTRYLDPKRVDIENRKGPGLASACIMCSAVAAEEVRKLAGGMPTQVAAPRGIYFDPYNLRTLPIRPNVTFGRGLRGRLVRYMAFRRFPGFKRLHEQELQAQSS